MGVADWIDAMALYGVLKVPRGNACQRDLVVFRMQRRRSFGCKVPPCLQCQFGQADRSLRCSHNVDGKGANKNCNSKLLRVFASIDPWCSSSPIPTRPVPNGMIHDQNNISVSFHTKKRKPLPWGQDKTRQRDKESLSTALSMMQPKQDDTHITQTRPIMC
jgi:hypothetical protein